MTDYHRDCEEVSRIKKSNNKDTIAQQINYVNTIEWELNNLKQVVQQQHELLIEYKEELDNLRKRNTILEVELIKQRGNKND